MGGAHWPLARAKGWGWLKRSAAEFTLPSVGSVYWACLTAVNESKSILAIRWWTTFMCIFFCMIIKPSLVTSAVYWLSYCQSVLTWRMKFVIIALSEYQMPRAESTLLSKIDAESGRNRSSKSQILRENGRQNYKLHWCNKNLLLYCAGDSCGRKSRGWETTTDWLEGLNIVKRKIITSQESKIDWNTQRALVREGGLYALKVGRFPPPPPPPPPHTHTHTHHEPGHSINWSSMW